MLRKRQSGITFIGFLFTCALIIFFAYLGMRLWPILNEKMKVDQALESVAARQNVATLNKKALGDYILRNFEVDDVDQFASMKDMKDVFSVNKIKGQKKRLMKMIYEIRRPILGDKMDIIYKYDKRIVIDGTGD